MDYTTYQKRVHKIGTITMYGLLVLTFLPVLYIFFVKDGYPGATTLAGVTAAMLAQEMSGWFTEGFIYYPIMGATCLYIGYVSGNVMAQRIPVMLACRKEVGAEPNTELAEVSGVIGVVSSVFVNIVILILVILFGAMLLNILPQAIKGAFSYASPSMMGAAFPMFIGLIKSMISSNKNKA